MRSIKVDIIERLRSDADSFTFSVAQVDSTFRVSERDTDKYPRVIVSEIVNTPRDYGTVNGEIASNLAYQFDVFVKDSVHPDYPTDPTKIIGRDDVIDTMVRELAEFVDTEFQLVRDFIGYNASQPDAVHAIIRTRCVQDKHGVCYRP